MLADTCKLPSRRGKQHARIFEKDGRRGRGEPQDKIIGCSLIDLELRGNIYTTTREVMHAALLPSSKEMLEM